MIAYVFLLNKNGGFLAIWRGSRRLCLYVKILIESEQILLQAASFFSSGKDVSSLKTGNNHE
jgi:hypothetical protein